MVLASPVVFGDVRPARPGYSLHLVGRRWKPTVAFDMKKSFQKEFLSSLRDNWATKYPFFMPIETKEKGRLKGGNYVSSLLFEKTGCYYFLSVLFSKTYSGRLTLEMSISDDERESVLDMNFSFDPDVREKGTYRLACLWGKSDFWWKFKKDDGDARFEELDSKTGYDSSKSLWEPVDYSVEEDAIIKQIIEDLNTRIDEFLMPILIGARAPSPERQMPA